MKIISKYKDFYDYLRGIYGEDEKLVLDRRNTNQAPYIQTGVNSVYICNVEFQVFEEKGQIYVDEELLDIGFEIREEAEGKFFFRPADKGNRDNNRWTSATVRSIRFLKPDKSPNEKENCPILLQGYSPGEYYKFPRLDLLKINKLISPHDIWILLSSWLSYKIPEMPVPIGDDKIRIQSHGFDLKTSFRKMKR